MKEAAGVMPINFELKQKRLKIDFFTSTPLQVVGFTKDGPAVSKYMALLLSKMV